MPETKTKTAGQQRYVLDGYLFASRQDYEQAQREAESITLIRSELDVTKEEELYKTYQKLTAKAEYHTPVGIGFMRELQRHLARREETRKGLPLIPVPASNQSYLTEEGDLQAQMENRLVEQRIQKELEAAYKGRYRNLWIVSGFLLALVLALFVITWKDKTIDIQAERDKILDEYAGWAEELTQKEAELQEREKALKGQQEGGASATALPDTE